jgi:hypothetical protein
MAVQGGWSWDRIQSEIDKCDVRCANCHRKKNYTTGLWNARTG